MDVSRRSRRVRPTGEELMRHPDHLDEPAAFLSEPAARTESLLETVAAVFLQNPRFFFWFAKTRSQFCWDESQAAALESPTSSTSIFGPFVSVSCVALSVVFIWICNVSHWMLDVAFMSSLLCPNSPSEGKWKNRKWKGEGGRWGGVGVLRMRGASFTHRLHSAASSVIAWKGFLQLSGSGSAGGMQIHPQLLWSSSSRGEEGKVCSPLAALCALHVCVGGPLSSFMLRGQRRGQKLCNSEFQYNGGQTKNGFAHSPLNIIHTRWTV